MKLLQEQRLEQHLVMTQEMRQSLEILQVSGQELKELIEKESEENPLLEIQIDCNNGESNNEEKEKIEDYYRDDDNYEEIKRISRSDDTAGDIINKLSVKEEDFIEKFLKELKNEFKGKKDCTLAEYIINNLDESGFFSDEIENREIFFIKNYGFDFELERFEYIRSRIKNIEPGGIASYGTEEYLIFQILDDEDSYEKTLCLEIIEQYFEELKRKKIRELKRKLSVSDEQLKAVYERIARCNPYPLRGYTVSENEKNLIIPEIILKEEENGFEIYLNDKNIPNFKLNQEYYKLLSQDKKAVEFLKEKAMRVRNLARSIEQRNLTLYRVAKILVEKQEEFLKFGEKKMHPLTLNEIGEELDLHESTISRVVNGKYMETPRGIYELKYFFSGKVKKEDSSDLSILAVQEMIKEIILHEDKKKPFNDKEICEVLENKKIKISKRTVANYRENLKILPTYLRKEL